MKTKNVIVLPYDIQWKTNFEIIKNELLDSIGDDIISIEHVGSTSVEGLSAKPIIDMDIVIKDFSVFQSVATKLNSIGYIHEGDLGIKDREAFTYTGKEHLQLHHLYVCPQNSNELKRHIVFRDFLRSNKSAVVEYGKVKEEAAKLFPQDIDRYIDYKSSCIEKLYRQCGLT